MNRKGVSLVLGPTGTVGSEVVRAASKRGIALRALVRSEPKRPMPAGVEVVRGDMRDEASLAAAMRGVRSVFYASPHENDEEELAERVIRACESAGARLVFVGVHVDGRTRVQRAIMRFLFGRVLPAYKGKLRLSERVRRSGTRPVLLLAPNFFQNDELFRPEIESGIFPMVLERPMSRVDVRDIGEVAARALDDDAMESGAYPVVGPASLTSADCARTWSEVLGRPVVDAHDLSIARARFDRALDGRKREDFVASFTALQRLALPTNPRELEMTTRLLGRPPTSYREYVARVAAAWARRAPEPDFAHAAQ